MAAAKKSWKIFFDLQCPYSKKCWEHLPSIKERFKEEYEITTHVTSLAFHAQAFPAQCAATLIGTQLGADARQKFEDMCFENQDSYMNAALGDCRKSDVSAVFADIADKAGLLGEKLNRQQFIADIESWEKAVKPAYAEHKVALAFGVYGTPKHVINEKLVADTESSWGADEWA
eukprot:CAMPEP_0116572276 /NCGR_PEP_ID=MMETSP0397-20121206/18078_1 /TAXON_ID=216820 /ORGANISM="Cyclophora tenuis, Strain ECT3854" /LENGTH=173 /DNA_ID=CAMNT_0004100571 /DNA_START=827 /DNA_END=1345 /DNA_ORIENTATION=+